jgi:ABC-type transport system involved in cytochrome bd biosynthesis fused ATPase/permease subunit
VILPVMLAVFWLMSPVLALAAGLPLAGAIAVAAVLAWRLKARQVRLRQRRAGLSADAMERIALAPAIDLIGRTGRELADLDRDGAALQDEAVGRTGQVAALRAVLRLGAAAAAVAVLAQAAVGGLAPGLAAAALALLGLVSTPLSDLAEAWDQYCAWDTARARMAELLAEPSLPREIAPRQSPVELRLRGLHTRLREGAEAVIAPGQLALIAGPTGSGKSRLARRIAGLDRAAGGVVVLYDGQPAPLPRIAQIGETPVILRGSLRRALTLGIRPRPSDRRIEARAREFGLEPLIDETPGITARVGEAGRTLSRGAALRVELARAALANPDLIVIDCPALEADPERADLIARLRRRTGATLVLVTQKPDDLPTDLVLVLGGAAAQEPCQGAGDAR